jgi:uncharacterized protein YjiS (DUF1127 family)
MIAHTDSSNHAELPVRLAFAFLRMVRNRRVLRELDAAQLADCGISREAMETATDWRFWRRLEEGAAGTRRAAFGRAIQRRAFTAS